MKQTMYGYLLFIAFSLICGCSKEKDPESNKLLIGTWQAIETAEYKPQKELILVFRPDKTIDKYQPLIGDKYLLLNEHTLQITSLQTAQVYQLEILFHTNDTITIFNFWDDEITQIVKNITFQKIQD